MKTTLHSIRRISIVALATTLAAAGCSKKEEKPPAPAAAPNPPTAPATGGTSTPAAATSPASSANAVTDAARQRASEVDAVMKDAAPAAGTAATASMQAMQTQAKQLLSQYSGELATLQTGAANLKALIDKHAAMLPAGISAKYQELNTLLPRLESMVESLKNYQTTDIGALVPKLQADFATAQKLYGEIKAALPAG
jgi:hypothetical protein